MKNKKTFIILVAIILIIAVIIGINLYQKQKEAGVVKIGVITPLTGPWATYGLATKQGLELALEVINNSKDLNEFKIKLIYEDSKGEPKNAINAFKKLVNIDKVVAVIGGFRSSETLAMAPEAEKSKIVLFSASSTADEIKYAGDYIFRNVPSNNIQGQTAAHFVIDALHKNTAAIFYQNDDYGKSLSEGFKSEFEKKGGRILITEVFEGGQTNFRDPIIKIKLKNPEVIFFPGNYQECGKILRQSKELALNSIFVGGDGAYSTDLIKIAGDAAEGSFYTIMSLGEGLADSLVSDFKIKFKEKYGKYVDVYAAYAYDALLTLVMAIKKSGADPDKIKNALYKIKYIGITGLNEFDEFGEVKKFYSIYVIKNKNFERVNFIDKGTNIK